MWNDLKFAVRQLRRNLGFTAVAVLTLALGIGANTAIFSVIDAVLLKPLPYAEPDRVVTLWEQDLKRDVTQDAVTPPNLEEWRKQNQVFEGLGYWTAFDANLVLADGVQTVRRAHPSSEVFSILRAQPLMGRTFTADEDQPEGNRAAIISYSFWQNRLGARTDVLGQTVTIDTYGRRDYTIVGVMPRSFTYPDKTELWLPAGWNGIPRTRHGHWLNVIGRLKSGVSLEKAAAEMNTIQSRIAAVHPSSLVGSSVSVVPLPEHIVGPKLKPALLMLSAVVAGVMLIACANVANLLLARAVNRQKEISLRTALGATRWRIIRQLLAESSLLAIAGGVAGALLGWWSLQILLTVSPADIPRLNEVRFDVRTLLFTIAVASATGIFFGLAPAWQSSRPDLDRVLREGSHAASSGVTMTRLRNALVMGEIAVSLLLLVGAALMIQAFAQILNEERGIRTEHVITAALDFSVSGYTTWIRATETRPQVKLKPLLDEIAAQPGVEYVAAASNLPRRNSGQPSQPFYVEGQLPGKPHTADYTGVTPKYFETMGIPLLRGRAFTEDDRLEAPQVLIINETLAKRCFAGQDPLGKRLSMSRNPAIPDTAELSKWPVVVGVVRDVKTLGVNPEAHPQVYVPYWQWPMLTPTAIVRAQGDPAGLTAMLRREVKETIPNIPVPKIQTMDSILHEVTAQPRFQTWLLSAFGGLAALLAGIGLYGTLAYAVAQRTHEIGIRMALGAERSRVLAMIIKDGMKLVVAGAIVGAVLSLASTRILAHAFFGIQPHAPLPIAAVTVLLFVIALCASYLPARRATKINPTEALRCD
jgi:putative ABC transport system permease protein